ncbi:FBP domain-containing protein [Microbacterium sp. NPDC077644]|uniref:FBP domain-containing protein n=1 Tax=Microbacterium sp. NPDC077644 TaxID=3155055 RepID=UPI00344F64E1
MRALTESDVRAAFINATDDELRMIEMPHDFLLVDWDFHDFLAWRDPASSKRGCILVQSGDEVIGVVVRASDPGRSRNGMCNICHTMQPGSQVALFTARKTGEAGRRGDGVGTYICADLSCHDNVRLAHPLAPNEIRAAGQVDMRLDGTRRRMEGFVARVQQETD